MTQAASAGALVQCEQGPEALATALAPLVLDRARARAQGQSGQAYVRKVHDWATIARATLKIYEEDAQRS
jgi:glycosyltransferase involved in cell wall biosynthesis